MNNLEVRIMIMEHNLKYYQVAEALGVSPYTFTIWLRKELSPERKTRVIDAIHKLIDERG